MPPQLIFDIAGLDLTKVLYDQEGVLSVNPQRGHMVMLNGIAHVDTTAGHIIGFKDTRDDEFWVPGHIPGRPLFPGVMMIEAGAQLASFYCREFERWMGFIGFGAASDCKFRGEVPPGVRMYLLGKKIWVRHSRIHCHIQGLVDGNLVFEGSITGVKM